MLALSDTQLDIIHRFAQPLDVDDRGEYLKRVAALLRGQEIGDGLVSRMAQLAQAEFRRMPAQIDGRGHNGGKYGR
jgi:hypothetical protein